MHAVCSATIVLRQSIEYSLDIVIFVEFIVIFMLLGTRGEKERFLSGWQQAFPKFLLLSIFSWEKLLLFNMVHRYEDFNFRTNSGDV